MAANNPLFDFSQPRVMAILNVTPDSFFAGSRMPDAPHVERRGREAVGRLCVRLAQRAECVVRMVCGIPTVIKGELPCRSI